MSQSAGPKLVIAISSTALFDMRESHSIYENQGVAAYALYQREHEDDILEPGEAFPLATKLLRINEKLGGEPKVEIVLLSRNSADTGLRVFNSIAHHGLNISRAAFSGGNSPYRYVSAFGCDLFLSTHAEDVRSALDSGMAAALSWALPVFFGGFYLAPCIAMTHGMVGLRMRALSSAVLFFVLNLIGLGLGPILTGYVADLLTPQFGIDGIRYAMTLTILVNIWCAFHYFMCTRTLKDSLDNAPA